MRWSSVLLIKICILMHNCIAQAGPAVPAAAAAGGAPRPAMRHVLSGARGSGPPLHRAAGGGGGGGGGRGGGNGGSGGGGGVSAGGCGGGDGGGAVGGQPRVRVAGGKGREGMSGANLFRCKKEEAREREFGGGPDLTSEERRRRQEGPSWPRALEKICERDQIVFQTPTPRLRHITPLPLRSVTLCYISDRTRRCI
jgi:hypothetical protein